MNILGFVAGLAGLAATGPAWGGGVILCDRFHCRSSPYFPPPIVMVRPPVVSTRPPVVYVDPPPQVIYPQRGYPNQEASPPPRRAAAAPPPRGPRETAEVEEGKEIEGDIMAFCDQNPDEPFCAKLGAFLRKHPDRRHR